MEPFKNLLNPALVRKAGARLQAAWPAFDKTAFLRHANRGLEALELKARAMQIADALEATLPAPFDQACNVIEAALAPASEPGQPAPGDSDGLHGWIVWPLGEFVARRGLAEPERALAALHALTQRLTAEFAIRPLIVAHPALVFATLQRWARDPSAHVRRLASEGSRPRLPWGLRLQALVADPTPTLPLLAALQDDPSDYVRRSVANHLNDIAKDHPQLVVQWVRQHLPGAGRERRALLKHASRTLIKHGHAEMLALWGTAARFEGRARLRLAPRRVVVGDSLAVEPEAACERLGPAGPADRLRRAPCAGQRRHQRQDLQGLDRDVGAGRDAQPDEDALVACRHDAALPRRPPRGRRAHQRPGGGRGGVLTGARVRRASARRRSRR